jgi:hypothetical protein
MSCKESVIGRGEGIRTHDGQLFERTILMSMVLLILISKWRLTSNFWLRVCVRSTSLFWG